MSMRAACQLIHVPSSSRPNISVHVNGKIRMTARVRGGGTVLCFPPVQAVHVSVKHSQCAVIFFTVCSQSPS